MFPDWDTTTGQLPPPPEAPPTSTERGVKMPIRKLTRAADRATRINAERAHNNSDPPPC